MSSIQNSEILILGGGVIGLSCAYYLIKAGRQVRIIERNEIGSGSSHGNCGWICSSEIIPLCAPGVLSSTLIKMMQRKSTFHIKPRLDPGLIAWLFHFSRNCSNKYMTLVIPYRYLMLKESRELYNKLIRDEYLDCDWKENGVLILCKDEKHMAEYTKANDKMKEYGFPIKPFIGKDLFELEPSIKESVFGAWFRESESYLRPDKLMTALKSILLRKGAIIEENCRLEKLNYRRNRLQKIQTSRGSFSADQFVFALGAWTASFAGQLGLKIPIQPGKGYSITTSNPSISPKSMCYFSEKDVIATPWSNGFRLGGQLSFSGFNNKLEKKRLKYLKEASKEYLKIPFGDHLQEEWTGFRPMSRDDMPIIDRSPIHKNIMIATGHGMLGITMAPATGKLIAEMLAGEKPFMDTSCFSIQRF